MAALFYCFFTQIFYDFYAAYCRHLLRYEMIGRPLWYRSHSSGHCYVYGFHILRLLLPFIFRGGVVHFIYHTVCTTSVCVVYSGTYSNDKRGIDRIPYNLGLFAASCCFNCRIVFRLYFAMSRCMSSSDLIYRKI